MIIFGKGVAVGNVYTYTWNCWISSVLKFAIPPWVRPNSSHSAQLHVRSLISLLKLLICHSWLLRMKMSFIIICRCFLRLRGPLCRRGWLNARKGVVFPLQCGWAALCSVGLLGAPWSKSNGPWARWAWASLPLVDFGEQRYSQICPAGPFLPIPNYIPPRVPSNHTCRTLGCRCITEVQRRSSFSLPPWPSMSQFYFTT